LFQYESGVALLHYINVSNRQYADPECVSIAVFDIDGKHRVIKISSTQTFLNPSALSIASRVDFISAANGLFRSSSDSESNSRLVFFRASLWRHQNHPWAGLRLRP